ncbi:hypothetical protein [Tenacibaculum caenipelagi]|uniref:WAP-type (Whey Acidic protein) with four-disulfide core n=1 Tax=Tenacibaculum caenipelagi TaxID=1325435 RepID=A0A4R6TDX4_9FLAO|nr:hypothetical protein [Tenacibaculum caenipelagi]TDQ23967.1 WAP-type (Whey Acidic protein) with four-disulfide core [Tenacibaculum caenipelagi]
MKKSILTLGKVLNKIEQKTINGGGHPACYSHSDCPGTMGCCNGGYGEMGICLTFDQYQKYCNL